NERPAVEPRRDFEPINLNLIDRSKDVRFGNRRNGGFFDLVVLDLAVEDCRFQRQASDFRGSDTELIVDADLILHRERFAARDVWRMPTMDAGIDIGQLSR